MRKGFSLYAPLVGVILLGVSLLILASFVNEENARVGYLRALRASYAYLLPTHSMRYDAFTAFSVAARIYFQDTPIELGEKPDIGDFLDGFLRGFITVPAGTGIKEARISWNENDVTIQEDVKDTYILLKVTVNRPPGPLYFLTLDAGDGREENLEVPIFEQKTTTIYIPYPYGKVQQIAQKIQSELAGAARAGNIAYGYCSKIFEDEGGTESMYILRNEKGRNGKKGLEDALKNLIGSIIHSLSARIDDVRITGFKTQHEVNKIRYISVDKDTLRCMLPYNSTYKNLVNTCASFYVITGESETTCVYVTSIGVEGSVEIGDERYQFDIVVPLTNKPQMSHNKTYKNPSYNLGRYLRPYIEKSAYCCRKKCKEYTDYQCNLQCWKYCNEETCLPEYYECIDCLNDCKKECANKINELVKELSRLIPQKVKDADDLKNLDTYCSIGIRTAILCDAESGTCHYQDRQGNKKR